MSANNEPSSTTAASSEMVSEQKKMHISAGIDYAQFLFKHFWFSFFMFFTLGT
jgi:hypothetical protein